MAALWSVREEVVEEKEQQQNVWNPACKTYSRNSKGSLSADAA